MNCCRVSSLDDDGDGQIRFTCVLAAVHHIEGLVGAAILNGRTQ